MLSHCVFPGYERVFLTGRRMNRLIFILMKTDGKKKTANGADIVFFFPPVVWFDAMMVLPFCNNPTVH